MKKMLAKEIRLAASMLSFLFIAGALLTFIPGYPVLVGIFFTTLGIFYSFQSMRENNDIQYSMLLPAAKADIVNAKYVFTVFIELCSFLVMTVITLIRMTLLKDAPVYIENPLMCANLTALGFALILYACFNLIFLAGFFRTAYYFGKPFVTYIVIAFLVVGLAETLHHLPGLEALNAFGFDPLLPQLLVLCFGAVLFAVLTLLSLKISRRRFEAIDL